MNYKQVVNATRDLAKLDNTADPDTVEQVGKNWLEVAEGYGTQIWLAEAEVRRALWEMQDVQQSESAQAFKAFTKAAKNYCELLGMRM